MAETTRITSSPSGEEIVRQGREIYERDLKRLLEPKHNGQWVVVHVGNGDYAVGPDKLRSVQEMQRKYPDDLFFLARVGQRAAITLWGAGRRA